MANYRVEWLNDNRTVIVLIYESGWTWDDMYHCNVKARSMLLTVPHAVYGITHFENAAHIPPDPKPHIDSVTVDYPPNVLGIVISAPNPILLDMIRMSVESNDPMPYDYVESLAEAVELLRAKGVDVD